MTRAGEVVPHTSTGHGEFDESANKFHERVTVQLGVPAARMGTCAHLSGRWQSLP